MKAIREIHGISERLRVEGRGLLAVADRAGLGEGDTRDLAADLIQAATILDRLTVDGLAGVMDMALGIKALRVDTPALAQALISYITAPSGELSGGIPGSISTAASSSAMASDSGQVKS